MKNKNDWRQSLLQYRSCNNKNSLNTCIQLRLWRVVQSFSAVLPILAYYPILGEVNLIPVYQALLKAQYPLYFPVTYSDGYMEFFLCQDLSELQKQKDSPLYEPLHTHISHRFDSQLQTIGIIPSLGLSKDGTRIGFGKGFYDRYLVRFSNIIKVAPQFSHSILEQIPADIWDIPMDFIISEKEVIDLSK